MKNDLRPEAAKLHPYEYRKALRRTPLRDLPIFDTGAETRNESWRKLLESNQIERMMYDVLMTIEKIGPCTDKQIAEALGIDVCSVTRPRGDLQKEGLIVLHDKVYNATTCRRRARWKVL